MRSMDPQTSGSPTGQTPRISQLLDIFVFEMTFFQSWTELSGLAAALGYHHYDVLPCTSRLMMR